jgi:hypothetical protein
VLLGDAQGFSVISLLSSHSSEVHCQEGRQDERAGEAVARGRSRAEAEKDALVILMWKVGVGLGCGVVLGE